jgi:hypothetical protein
MKTKLLFLFALLLNLSASAQVNTISETFESVSALPTDWTTSCSGCAVSVISALPQQGVKSLRVQPGPTNPSTFYLVLPRVIDTRGTLNFYARGLNLQSGSPVTIIKVGTVSSPTDIASFSQKLGNTFLANTYTNINLNLSSNVNGHEYIAIQMNSQTFADYYHFDNFVYTSAATLGVDENSAKEQFSVYPNPANNILNIRAATDSEIQKVSIFDIAGKQLKQQVGNVTSIAVDDLNSGFYLLEITIDGKTTIKKFVKQ